MRKSIYSPEARAISRILVLLRQEAGLLQGELSERLKRPQAYVSRFESGEKMLDLPELCQICAALGISLSVFVSRFEAEIEEQKAGESVETVGNEVKTT